VLRVLHYFTSWSLRVPWFKFRFVPFRERFAVRGAVPGSTDYCEYLRQILDLLPNEEKIICCSDIIESFFGKFKYRKTNSAKGISEDLLAMPLFDDKLNAAMMKKALEEFTLNDIKEWGEKYTVPTLRKIQFMFWRNLLSKTG
jgi:hypothetical protein